MAEKNLRSLKLQIRFPSGILLLYVLLAGLPLLLLITSTFASILAGGNDWVSLVFPSGRRLALLLRTVCFALAVAIPGTALGFLGAGTLRFTRSRILRGLAAFLIPSAAIPPHIHAMAWSALILRMNGVLRVAGLPGLPDQGFLVSAWVQMLALLPFSLGILFLALAGIPNELLEASRVSAPDKRTMRRVLLPLALPGLSASFSFLFLVSLLDYSVPSLFQLNLYTLGIFSEYSIAYDASHAFLMSLPLLLVSLPAAWLLQHALRGLPLIPPGNGRSARWPIRLPVWMQTLSVLSVLVFLLQLLVPLVVLTLKSLPAFTSLAWLTSSLPDLGISALIGLGTALFTLPFAHTAASAIHGRRRDRHAWWCLVLLPMAIPAPLIGIALAHAWNDAALSWTGLYNTLFMPILACTLRFLPFSVFLLLAKLKRMDRSLFDAAAVLQKNNLQTLFHIHLPLMSGVYLGTGLLAAVLAVGELGATILLVPPGAGTLTLKIYNYLHYGASETVSGLCLLLYLIALAIGFFLRKTTTAAHFGSQRESGATDHRNDPGTTVHQRESGTMDNLLESNISRKRRPS